MVTVGKPGYIQRTLLTAACLNVHYPSMCLAIKQIIIDIKVLRVSSASQSDRWLRQAELMDGWNISTIDTAIAFRWGLYWRRILENITLKYNQFRKISRGRIWLDYKNWKDFLLELSAAKKLGLTDLISKLEMCGKPAINLTRRKKNSLSWWTNEDIYSRQTRFKTISKSFQK